MKKIISILLCITLLFGCACILASCKKADGGDTDRNEQDYTSAIALIASGDYAGAKALFEKLGDYKDSKEYLSRFYYMPTSFTYDLLDKKGANPITYDDRNLPACEIIEREDVVGKAEFFYDDNGNIIEQRVVNNGFLASYFYEYDDNGKRIGAVYSAEDGSTANHVFEYDDKGNTVKETYTDVDGGVYIYLMEYDEHGNMIRQEGVYGNGESTYVLYVEYTYDDNGRVIREVWSYPDGSQETTDHTYDERGNHTSEIYTDEDGEQCGYTFTYDENNSMIREVYTHEDGTVETVEIEYTLKYIPCGVTYWTETFFISFWADRL